MTVITVKMTKLEETFYFNPPLPPAKEIKILNLWRFLPFSTKVILEIVDPLSHYSKLGRAIDPFPHYSKLGRGKIKPTRLVAYAGCSTKGTLSGLLTCPPEKFPTVKVRRSNDPINSIKIILEDKRISNFPDSFKVFRICLKIYH